MTRVTRAARRAAQTGRHLGISLALGGVLVGTLISCKSDSTFHGQTSGDTLITSFVTSFDLGETLFDVTRGRLEAENAVDTPARLAALDARRTDFVNAVNQILDASSLRNLGPTLAAMLDLIDDGTIPGMAADIAAILDDLVAEPDKKTMRAFVSLGSARTVIQSADLIDFVSQTAADPEIERTFEAIATLMRENDGVDDNGQPNGERDILTEVLGMLSRLLRSSAQAPTAPPGTGLLAEIRAELLAHAPPRGRNFGHPAWVVLADRHGNPRVAIDAATQRVHPPFVDLDGDGAADIDADGTPIDANGQAISLAPFGLASAPSRDGYGRALTASGALLYDYVDAKETLLSHLLQLAGEGMRRSAHLQAAELLDIALGARVPHDNGTPADPTDDFIGIDVNNPITDLAWGLLETWRPNHVGAVQRALAEIGLREPALAEDLLVAAGRILERARPITFSPGPVVPDPASRQRTDRVLSMIDRLFQTQGPRGSTARILIERLHQLGQSSRDLPRQLALLARYRHLALDAQGNLLPSSLPVDRSAPAQGGAFDNRSSLEQTLSLLANADSCRTFVIAGKPLAETIIELMGGQSVGTVSTLIDLLQLGWVRSLVTLICPGIGPDLDGLEALRASGALNAFLPIAEVFVQNGETRLLVDLIKLLAQDYAQSIRPHEEPLADLLASGAIDALFDLIDLVVAGRQGGPITDPVTGIRAMDAFMDGLATLLRHPAGGVRDRRGRTVPSQAHLLVVPMRDLEDRLHAAGGANDIFAALMYNLTDLLVERHRNDNGTPFDLSDDFDQLRNPSLVPFVGRTLHAINRHLPMATVDRARVIADAQQDLVTFMGSRDAAAVLDFVDAMHRAPATSALRRAAVDLLTPDLTGQPDVFGSLLKVVVSAMQTEVDQQPLRDIAGFLADLFEPANQRLARFVLGINRLLQKDRGQVIMALVRNSLDRRKPGSALPVGLSPVEMIMEVYDDLRAASAPTSTVSAVDRMEAWMVEIARFIRDPQNGLERVFEMVRQRGR